MTDEHTTPKTAEDDEPRPLALRIVGWIGLAIAVALLIWAALHVGIPTINPKRKPPAGHYAGACWSCHLVSDKAPLGDE